MSWNPFKKAFSGRRMRSEDVEFEREVNKLRQMQAVSKRMYKDMRKCNDAESALVRSGQRVVSDLKSCPLGKTEPLKPTMEALNATMEELHSHSKTLKNNQELTFTEPMKKFNNVYKHVEFHAKQRELKLQEFEKQQAKLEKLERKAQSQPFSQSAVLQPKLEQTQRALTSSRADYDRVHSRMMQEMPELYEGRVGYFEHCLQAAIESQALYYQDCSKTLHNSLTTLQGSSELMTEKDITKNSEKLLADIKALSIVGATPVP